MKTTIDLPEDLLRAAQQAARAEKTTLKSLVETGLRTELKRRHSAEKFRLRDGSVNGDGLTPEFANGSWEQIRDASYGSGEPQ